MSKLLIGTLNPGKQDEIRHLLADKNLQIATPQELGLSLTVEETGANYRENAALKALAFSQASGLWALADDTGLEVEALGGAPGLHSARLATTTLARRRALLEMLDSHPRPWKATFRSTVALASPEGQLVFGEGTCPGEIVPEARGVGGFGYDPIFLVEGTEKTMAELTIEEKNLISHRAQALDAIKLELARLPG